MRRLSKSLRYLFAQVRLYYAERLILWAVRIAPKRHPDSIAIYRAAQIVFSRKPG